MNTRLLMVLSAAWLGLAGLVLSFAPQETLLSIGASPDPLLVILVQVLGAGYLGFGFLNWAARGNLIGGIYSRPVAIGNMFHFLMGALALVKLVLGGNRDLAVLVITPVYVLLAVAFVWVAYGSAVSRGNGDMDADRS